MAWPRGYYISNLVNDRRVIFHRFLFILLPHKRTPVTPKAGDFQQFDNMLPHRQTLPALMDGRGRGRRINPSQIQARPPPLTRAPVITARRNNYRVDQQQDFQHHNNQQGEPAATAPARLVADANDIRRQLEQQVNGNPGDNDTEPESDEEAETNRDRELRALYGEPIRLIPPGVFFVFQYLSDSNPWKQKMELSCRLTPKSRRWPKKKPE